MKIGLKFNPNKCCTLHYSNKPSASCRHTIVNLTVIQILSTEDGESATILGKPIGVFLPKDMDTVNNIKQRGTKNYDL